MPATLERNQALYDQGDKHPVGAGDLDQDTVKVDTEVTVFQEEILEGEVAWFGAGSHEREVAEAFIFASLVASGAGAGTAGDPITGDLMAVITDSRGKRVLAETTVDSLGELADAEADSRTDRPIQEALGPYAKPGRHLEFRVVADAASDGMEIDPAASSARLYYSTA